MVALYGLTVILGMLAVPAAAQGPVNATGIVAAENFYGDVAQQLAGNNTTISSILSNPDQDPHLFEASPSVARLLSGAAIVIYNGADYDPWMTKLLAATPSPNREVIVVADLVHRKPGDNPHLWYDPPTMPIFAKALAKSLSDREPSRRHDFDVRLRAFLESLQPLDAKIAKLRQAFGGTPLPPPNRYSAYMAMRWASICGMSAISARGHEQH